MLCKNRGLILRALAQANFGPLENPLLQVTFIFIAVLITFNNLVSLCIALSAKQLDELLTRLKPVISPQVQKGAFRTRERRISRA